MLIEPLYDIEAQVWAVDYGDTTLEAKTLRELKQLLPDAEIANYHPDGLTVVRDGFLEPSHSKRIVRGFNPHERIKATVNQAKAKQIKREQVLAETKAARQRRVEYDRQHRIERERKLAQAKANDVILPRSYVNREALLDLWASGKSALEVAKQLGYAVNTVERYIREARAANDPRAFRDRKHPVRGTSVSWSDDDLKQLRKLAADGLTADCIGSELGRSKNAVIGKCHRIGIQLQHPNFRDGYNNKIKVA